MKKAVSFMAVIMVLFTVAALNLSGALSGTEIRDKTEPEKGIFDSFSSFDASEVENKIRKAENERLQKQGVEEVINELEEGTVDVRKIFADTCFVGDSLMNGLEIYDILNSDMLMTQVSAGLDHLEGCIGSIISINPENLILHYGLNMLSEFDYGKDDFIDYYSELINEIKKALPSTRIIISSIFSVDTESATDEIFKKIPEYNKALESMCNKINVEFLDSTQLLSECGDYYADDGIHLSPGFYSQQWLPFIVESKGIVG